MYDLSKYDFVVVGAGLTGSTIAREPAEFKYYNMDQAVLSDLNMANKIMEVKQTCRNGILRDYL